MAVFGRQDKYDAIKGAILFFVMLLVIVSTTYLSSTNSVHSSYYSGERSTLFSCIEYDESYMTCSFGNLK